MAQYIASLYLGVISLWKLLVDWNPVKLPQQHLRMYVLENSSEERFCEIIGLMASLTPKLSFSFKADNSVTLSRECPARVNMKLFVMQDKPTVINGDFARFEPILVSGKFLFPCSAGYGKWVSGDALLKKKAIVLEKYTWDPHFLCECRIPALSIIQAPPLSSQNHVYRTTMTVHLDKEEKT